MMIHHRMRISTTRGRGTEEEAIMEAEGAITIEEAMTIIEGDMEERVTGVDTEVRVAEEVMEVRAAEGATAEAATTIIGVAMTTVEEVMITTGAEGDMVVEVGSTILGKRLLLERYSRTQMLCSRRN